MLDGEAPHIPAPHNAQVSRQRTADPGQPQGPRWQFLVGQALDLDADDAEWRIRCASHVEIGPGIDTDFAIGGVDKLGGTLRLAMRGLIGQPKRLTMQARPTAPWVPLGGAIHHAVFGQADQEIRGDRAVRQRLQVIATVERHDWAWCVCGLGLTHSSDLLKRHLRRRLGRRSTALHVQRQHPTAGHLRHGHQPLVLPGGHHPVLGPASQRPVRPCAFGAGACRWAWPVGAVDHPQRPAVDQGRVRQRPGKQVAQRRHFHRAICQRVAGARPEPAENGRQAEPHQRAALGCRQDGIHQLEQAILTEAQVVVELLPKAEERRPSFGFVHTPSLARFHRNRKTLRPPGPVCYPKSS